MKLIFHKDILKLTDLYECSKNICWVEVVLDKQRRLSNRAEDRTFPVWQNSYSSMNTRQFHFFFNLRQNLITIFCWFMFLLLRILKPFQNEKDQKNLKYSIKKQAFFVGYLKFFWPFLFWHSFRIFISRNWNCSAPVSVDLRVFRIIAIARCISIVWRAASWSAACRRRQLSVLEGDKYDWLLNLQTLFCPLWKSKQKQF